MTVKIPTITPFESGQRMMPPEMQPHVTVCAAIDESAFPSKSSLDKRTEFLMRNLSINLGSQLYAKDCTLHTKGDGGEGEVIHGLTVYPIPASYVGDFLQYSVDHLYWQSYLMKDEAGGAQVRRLVDMIIVELSQDMEKKDQTERPVVTPA